MQKIIHDFFDFVEIEIQESIDIPFSSEVRDITRLFYQKKLFSTNTIQSYTIRKTFEGLSKNGFENGKSKIVKEIAIKYGLHENSVWNALKDIPPKN